MKRELLAITFLLFSFTISKAQENVFDASRTGNLEAIQKLHKINPNIINSLDENGYSPLVLACYYGHDDVVTFLVSKVKNLNIETSYGSPLMAATVKGYSSIVDILLEHKANPNLTDQQGTTAAHFAVMFKKYDIIEQLVKSNADFTIKNNVGKSAMDYAMSMNDKKLNALLNLPLAP